MRASRFPIRRASAGRSSLGVRHRGYPVTRPDRSYPPLSHGTCARAVGSRSSVQIRHFEWIAAYVTACFRSLFSLTVHACPHIMWIDSRLGVNQTESTSQRAETNTKPRCRQIQGPNEGRAGRDRGHQEEEIAFRPYRPTQCHARRTAQTGFCG